MDKTEIIGKIDLKGFSGKCYQGFPPSLEPPEATPHPQDREITQSKTLLPSQGHLLAYSQNSFNHLICTLFTISFPSTGTLSTVYHVTGKGCPPDLIRFPSLPLALRS
ncbi:MULTISPECIES: hypothetical protein [Metallosphaera]|uniref:hypothetical protein n=1 Tax=Metallosphaera TaxID=41980 RepID=UPI001EDD42EC|nr:hypothetical protein [Metallosphaera javensis (ex Hofmann et al. 2022)]BCS94292.1 MAG: hypothetical protein MjAS7_2900 [Metallosphaera javensis (ex Sakai et al. 2022)]